MSDDMILSIKKFYNEKEMYGKNLSANITNENYNYDDANEKHNNENY
jgi:hypothetical protein